MREHSKILYHLNELEIANDPDSPHHVLPCFYEKTQDVPDIGAELAKLLLLLVWRKNSKYRCRLEKFIVGA